jgi:hypothetical protein
MHPAPLALQTAMRFLSSPNFLQCRGPGKRM